MYTKSTKNNDKRTVRLFCLKVERHGCAGCFALFLMILRECLINNTEDDM